MTSRRFLPALLLLFVGSGCAALIYEIVWFQLLQLVIGSSAISLAVLLGTFMGGMCLGSLWLPRAVSSRHHPLRVYALLELGVGACGLALLAAMPLVGRVYFAAGGSGGTGFLVRPCLGGVPAAADHSDGRDAASGVALDRDHAGGCVVAGMVLRREHRRRRLRVPRGGLLPSSLLRHGVDDVRGCRVERCRGRTRVEAGDSCRPAEAGRYASCRCARSVRL
jgi:hypothetical protein